jgi:DNA-binding MarR family transcriptional regulator
MEPWAASKMTGNLSNWMAVKRKQRAPRRRTSRRKRQRTQEVVDETIALFRWLAWVSEELYGDEGRGVARRWVLRRLVRDGPQTVPQLARTRRMRRQSMQPIVDALVAEALVSWKDNPAHARSRLAEITANGKDLVVRLDDIDARVLRAVGRGIPEEDLECTARTLRALREGFELEPRWRRVLPE